MFGLYRDVELKTVVMFWSLLEKSSVSIALKYDYKYEKGFITSIFLV